MRSRAAYALALTAALGASGLAGVALAGPAQAKAAARPYDFNGDGRRDLAVGSPNGTVGKKKKAGFVTVVYGSKSGLNTTKRQVITQATAGVPGAPEAGDLFGASVTSADFDRDGYADLAVGAPGEDTGAGADAGTVTVLWGSPSGLKGATSFGEKGSAGKRHRYGESLTAGDLQGDGRPELFITVPGTSTYTWVSFAGRKASGRNGTRSSYDVDRSWIAAGDVNGDGRADVVYAWFDDNDPEVAHRRGLTLYTANAWGGFDRNKTVYTDVHALTVADFDGDGRADVAVGDTYDSPWVGGSVTVFRGSPLGLGGSYALHRNSAGVPGVSTVEDDFGAALAAGDVNGDGRADLAVGVPKADQGRVFDSGAVVVLYGSASGLAGRGAQAVTKSTAGVPGTARAYEHLGAQVALLDHDGDGRADLTAGIPDADGGNGGLTCLRGSAAGVTAKGAAAVSAAALGVRSKNARVGILLGG
ncbi:FG-GAP-like repeat-containing protein [Actinomadura atramentaria]|uniref:FG-GAP-like repeat-containing protein n=1 Tax=Actinomadura atramentaria TaxID=1990 RepID=UPI00036E32B8|nr:FG-GAP-like repeat-containing protein [Actinomadura atramentaria]